MRFLSSGDAPRNRLSRWGRRLSWLLPAFALLVPAMPAHAASGPAPAFQLCVLDQVALLQRSQVAIREAARFQQLRRQAQDRLDADRTALETDDEALALARPGTAPVAYAARKSQLDARRQDLMARAAQLNVNFAQLDTELTNIVMRVATPAITQVENDRGCSALAAKSFFLAVSPALDISDEVVRRMNAAAPR